MKSFLTKILFLLAITLSSTVFGDDNSAAANQDIKSLSFGYLLKSFPLCKISSSYGQRCKSLSKNVRNSFSPEDIDGIQKIETIDNELVIETDDWYYSFEVKSISDNSAVLQFTDDAKFASYLVSEEYKLNWKSEAYNWEIVGGTVTYMSGNSDNVDEYDEYVNPKLFLIKK